MPWSELQRSDKVMCFVAIVGGIIALVETLLHMINLLETISWSFGIMYEVIALVLALLTILIGVKPIHYAPTFLTVFGILIIIFGSWIGGIVVLLAGVLGAIT